jgi:hypothetical protein
VLRDTYETVEESVYLRLDFYPLCTFLFYLSRERTRTGEAS